LKAAGFAFVPGRHRLAFLGFNPRNQIVTAGARGFWTLGSKAEGGRKGSGDALAISVTNGKGKLWTLFQHML
jgi:hypothetical protein